ncbi:hypothetical protein FNF31_00957 [Cafeteria roenbergensis]|uniref:Uncharacterized protein n=1 Tax=Cafeteria roenbergensis TaxID=33653 RepID=A0A5A8DQV3_CAFRO|nr:hypothetical protein FNF31_00957 [Cafeteria roenbergensis]KAA0172432.1 hypothetical protein FNF28_00115 [Cafeteria roenbergensis]
MIAVVALLALLGSASACTGQNTWDFFMLVMQWPPTQCMSQNYGCSTYSKTFFTLHGLWPDNVDGSYPCTCTNEQFDENAVSSIMPEMEKFWPSYASSDKSFWSHEWTKHGTCATYNSTFVPDQKAFFEDALNLRSKFSINQALAQAGILPSDSSTVSSNNFVSAISSAVGGEAAIDCDSKGNLDSVTICVSPNLQPMACPPAVTPNRCPSQMTFPATNKAYAPLLNATFA